MQKCERFTVENNSIREIIDFVEQSLKEYGLSRKAYIKALLTVEEAAVSIIENWVPDPEKSEEDQDKRLNVRIRNVFGSVSVELSAKGREYSLENNMSSVSMDALKDEDNNTQEIIRNILLNSLTDSLKYKHQDGTNYIRMIVVSSKNLFLYQTLGAMAVAVLLGFVFSLWVPASVNTFLNDLILVRIKTMYLNALKMVVAPVVFFSIVSCIAQFTDISALGRIGGKIIGLYLFTTVLAVSVGIGVFYLLNPLVATGSFSTMVDASAITSQTMEVSLGDTIVNIIPSDFITPFQKSNMLQLIFMAIICGIASGLLGKYSQNLQNLFSGCNELFLKITTIIIRFMPIAVFCSMMSMIITMGIETMLSLLGIFALFLIGLLVMMIVYCILLTVFGRLNPIPFVRKYAPFMIQIFSMASSNASIPVNMEACEKKLGIKKKIYSLSIPIGATINMDGTCVYLGVFALCLAKMYGVSVGQGGMLSMIISIIVLSIGAPGIAGAGLICLSVLLTQLGVPVEAVGIIMGVDSLCGMFRTMSNCLGDVAVTTIVAKSEGEFDQEMYNRQ